MALETSPYESIGLPVPNGASLAPPSATTAVPPISHDAASSPRRLPRRVVWIRLADEGEYAEFALLVKLRFSDELNEEFSSGELPRIRKALQQIVLEHNGWLHPDTGEPMPPASDPAFWEGERAVPQEEILLILKRLGVERGKVLDSMMGGPKS